MNTGIYIVAGAFALGVLAIVLYLTLQVLVALDERHEDER